MSNASLAHLPIADRIRLSVDVDDVNGCWVWRRGRDSHGYGTIHVQRKQVGAHRVSYETFVGPIPEGLQLDHLCRNRACVNPGHLEPVTSRINTNRSPFANAHVTSCPRGHAYDDTNTYYRDGHRDCRLCRTIRRRLLHAMTPQQREERKSAGLPLVDLDAYFASHALPSPGRAS